jgi:hypothetical protein
MRMDPDRMGRAEWIFRWVASRLSKSNITDFRYDVEVADLSGDLAEAQLSRRETARRAPLCNPHRRCSRSTLDTAGYSLSESVSGDHSNRSLSS